MKKFTVLILVLLFSIKIYAANDTTEIIIIHTNDMHSKIDNFAKFALFVDSYKKKYEHVFVISAGDIFTGNPITDQYEKRGWPIIDLMNQIPYDLTCIGNHEFDYGQKDLNYLTENSNFPYICANIEITDEAELYDKEPYHKLSTDNGITLGFLGLIQIGDNMLPATNPIHLNGIRFSDPIATAKEYETYKDSSDIFIALTHLGFEKDIVLAETHSFFDVIIGGHSHTKIPSGKFIDDILISQSGSYMNYAGVLSLSYAGGELIEKKDTMISLRDVNEFDPEIQKIIDTYNNNPKFNEVLAIAENEITGNDELGALITDAMIDTLKTDIAFVNNGGIRLHNIEKGDIRLKQVFELSPFSNTYIIYDLNPQEIKELINYAFDLRSTNELQVSGLHIKFILENDQLKKTILKDKNGKKLKNKKYSVAINDYMAATYQLDFLANWNETAVVDSECLIHYLKKKKTINYSGVQRVTTEGATENESSRY
jgi:5'-nucleotidase/UDP-sugar diphosphatase